MATKKPASTEYDADSVKHLGSREAVQQKTAMYAGSTDEHGLFTCLRETTDNIIDEAINGYCTEGEVVVFKDLEYWVRDNGRGMPIGMMTVIDSVSNRPHKIPAIQAITSLLHAGGKLNDEADSAYKISRGCFTGNTKVRLLNGKTVTFAKLYKRWLKNQTPIDVLTYDLKKHKLVPTKISNVILSKYVTETVTVHTSNGGKIECTPDHKFYTNTDEGKIRPVPAGKLEVGTSLVTTYNKIDNNGYVNQTEDGRWKPVHRVVGETLGHVRKGIDHVHHKSEIKTDNRPCNLEIVSQADHSREHMEMYVSLGRNKIMSTQADLREMNSERFTEQNSTLEHKTKAAQTKALNIAARILYKTKSTLTEDLYEEHRTAAEASWTSAVQWFTSEDHFVERAEKHTTYLISRIGKSAKAEDILYGVKAQPTNHLQENSDIAQLKKFQSVLKSFPDPQQVTPEQFNKQVGATVFGRYAKLCAVSSFKALKETVKLGSTILPMHEDLSDDIKTERMIKAELRIRSKDTIERSARRFLGTLKSKNLSFKTKNLEDKYIAGAKYELLARQTFRLNIAMLKKVHGKDTDLQAVLINYNCKVSKVTVNRYATRIPVFDLTVDHPDHVFFVDSKESSSVLVKNSHGVGQKLPNFLSFNFEVFTFSSPKTGTPKYWHSIKYTNGKLTSELAKCPPPVHPVTGKKVDKGTIVKFKLNPKFFSAKSFPPSLLLEYLQTSSYFTPGFTWTLTAAASGKSKTYHSENGALDYITEYKSKLPKVASMKPDSIFICSSPIMDVAVDFTTAEGNHLKGFTNGLFNAEGGDHVDSFFRTLQKALEPYKKKRKDFTLTEIKEGVLGIVNAKLAAPKFSSQVKVKLQDERAGDPFRKLLQVEMDKFFKKNKTLAEAICVRCAELKNLRSKFLASKQVVMELRKIAKKGFPVKALMAPKCKASERELYLVEGDSAMGGITGVRNAHFQEVFPLKGKIMNAHRATSAKFFQNEEVLNILAMIGFDPKAADPYSNLRVSKLVFMTDADADGFHISVLLLSMVHKYFPELIERGIIYVVEVPEFMAVIKNKPIYADSKDEMKRKLEDLKSPKSNVFHFKGLGEMESDVLGAVGMNPATRMIRQITPTDSPTYNEDFISIVSGDASSRRTLLGI